MTYAVAMSRGHGRVQRIILQSVNSTRYGCTIRQLAYLTYGIDREDGPSEAQTAAVRRAVGRLLQEERVIERVMFGTDRYILPATPPAARPRQRRSTSTGLTDQQTLQCNDCDIRWVSEERAPHRLCWSCGEPGKPARVYARRRVANV
jgi:ribosomal protein L32